MAWARFESDFTRHGKVQRITAELRPAALALDVAAICYSVDVLSDGFISASMAHSLAIEIGILRAQRGAEKELAKCIVELVRVGLWDQVQDGYEIHDFLDYQPSAEEVKEQRKAATERKRRSRSQLRIDEGHGERHTVTPPARHTVTSHAQAPAHDARAHPQADALGPSHSPNHTEEPSAEDLSLSADRSEITANGLPVEKERLVLELLGELGESAAANTPGIVRSYARQLPEGTIAKVLESVRQSTGVKNRAGYVVKALQGEWTERHNDEHGSRLKELQQDPEAYVRELGWKMPAEVLSERLALLLPSDEDERIRLTDLAADLRSETAA